MHACMLLLHSMRPSTCMHAISCSLRLPPGPADFNVQCGEGAYLTRLLTVRGTVLLPIQVTGTVWWQVTIGEEGFFGPNDPNIDCNPGEPGASWASQSGQDFTNNHRSKDIDFCVRAPPAQGHPVNNVGRCLTIIIIIIRKTSASSVTRL